MNLIMPCGVTRYRNVLNGTMLGDEGKLYEVQNNFYDFNKMPDPSICNMVKYYCDEPVSKGHCGIYYPSNNVSYILDYDAQKLPYLGVWITAGGLQGEYNCALEPSNGYYDSIGRAYENKKLPILRQGESFNFELRITLKEV
jgi:galactose mutarotase-like enzyme